MPLGTTTLDDLTGDWFQCTSSDCSTLDWQGVRLRRDASYQTLSSVASRCSTSASPFTDGAPYCEEDSMGTWSVTGDMYKEMASGNVIGDTGLSGTLTLAGGIMTINGRSTLGRTVKLTRKRIMVNSRGSCCPDGGT